MAIAHVSTSSMAQVAAGTGTTKTISTSSGDYLFAAQAYFTNGTGALTVGDDKGNSWVEAILGGSVGGSYNRASIWYAKVTTAGSTVVTWTLPSGSYMSGAVSCFSGIASSSALDKTDENSGSTTGGPNNSPALDTTTLAQADELVIAAVCSNTLGSPTIDAYVPTGFSSIWTNPSGATYQYGDGRYKIVSATDALAPQWSFGGLINVSVVVATFKAEGAATGHPAMRRLGGVRFGRGVDGKRGVRTF